MELISSAKENSFPGDMINYSILKLLPVSAIEKC